GSLGPAQQGGGRPLGAGCAHHGVHMLGDLGKLPNVVGAHHAHQHPVGVATHAFQEQLLGQLFAEGAAFFGLGTWVGGHQGEGVDQVGKEPAQFQGDLAPHGQAHHVHCVQVQVLQQAVQVTGEGVQVGDLGGDGGVSVAAQVRGDHPISPVGQGADLGVPHRVVEGVSVDEQDGTACAVVEVGDVHCAYTQGAHVVTVFRVRAKVCHKS